MATPLDRFTNLAQTTLGAAITVTTSPVTITVASASGFPASGSYRILIDNELFQVTSGAGTTSWVCTRPVDNTSAVTHLINATVTHVLTAFEANSFRQEYNPLAYGGFADGSTDDTNAFQGAINDAHTNGGVVYIGSWAWKINSALTTYSNVVFLSAGAVITGAGASSVAPIINTTLNGTLLAVMLSPSGLTGAATATRYVGGTTTGSPGSGTFQVGDWVVTQDGRMWICTTAGSPGTWQQPSPPLSFGSAANIQPLAAAAAAGSSGLVADAAHVHATTGAQSWPSLQTFNGGIALGSTSLTKTRNASDNVPLLGSGTGTSNGVQLWITTTDPTSSANNGDVWFDA